MSSLDLTVYLGLPPADWQALAACLGTDTESFFPEKGHRAQTAKRVCARCEVRVQCLGYALDRGDMFGVWGGLTETERRKLRQPTELAA